MKTGAKVAIGTGLAGLFTTVIYFVTRKKPPIVPEEAGATLQIVILDAQGNPVPQSSPAALVEGQVYFITTTITNTSTRAGVQCAATLTYVLLVTIGGVVIIPPQDQPRDYGPAQTLTATTPLTIPVGSAGKPGVIMGNVRSPADVQLANAYIEFSISAAAIIYGATITIGVS